MTGLSLPPVSCCSGVSPGDYVDPEAGLVVLGFVTLLRSCEFVCIGREVQGYRMNGQCSLLHRFKLIGEVVQSRRRPLLGPSPG